MQDRLDPQFLPPDTYTVSQLGAELKAAVNQIFAGIWLVGEVQRLTHSRPGHLYLQLVEKGYGDQVRGSLGAVIFRKDLQRIQRELRRSGLEIVEGQQLRCFAQVDFYPPQGRLQLVVRDVDAVFALGDLEQRRRETLAHLARLDLLELNRQRRLSEVPLFVALIASRASAGYEDFLATLRSSGLPFRVQLFDVAVQGQRAEGELRSALTAVARLHQRTPFDAAVVVRGGGSRSDLAAFDARLVAEAIARLPLPVLTGLGHETDRSVADEVAHTARKTPTSVAEFLVQRCQTAAARVLHCEQQIVRHSFSRLEEGARRLQLARVRVQRRAAALERFGDRLTSLQRTLVSCAERAVAAARQRSGSLAGRFSSPAVRRIAVGKERLDRLGKEIHRGAEQQLTAATTAVEGRARLVSQLDPQRVLARGFSITRGPRGDAVRSASSLVPGDRVVTQLARGSLRSIVEESSSASPAGDASVLKEKAATAVGDAGARDAHAAAPSDGGLSTEASGSHSSRPCEPAPSRQRELPV